MAGVQHPGRPFSVGDMLLAELEIFHSRPIAPTRRLALGHLNLPVDPAPGFGGILIAAVVSAYVRLVDDELVPDIGRLLVEVDSGRRVVQPRLRHRFQVDRHGLTHSVHRLKRIGDSLEFETQSNGSALQQVLGAVYSMERLDPSLRASIVPLVRKAMQWRGPIGASFVTYLMGGSASSIAAVADPRAWALEILGFPVGTVKPSKREVTSHYRRALRNAHPDHGGDVADAHRVIADITEARRILVETS